jgi:copper chaperone
MRHSLVGTIALSFIVLTGCKADTSPPTTQSALVGTNTATLTVKGLSCPQCAHNVDKQLLKLPGVSAVNVDLGKGLVTLSFAGDQRPTRQQIEQAISDSGFTLDALSTP